MRYSNRDYFKIVNGRLVDDGKNPPMPSAGVSLSGPTPYWIEYLCVRHAALNIRERPWVLKRSPVNLIGETFRLVAGAHPNFDESERREQINRRIRLFTADAQRFWYLPILVKTKANLFDLAENTWEAYTDISVDVPKLPGNPLPASISDFRCPPSQVVDCGGHWCVLWSVRDTTIANFPPHEYKRLRAALAVELGVHKPSADLWRMPPGRAEDVVIQGDGRSYEWKELIRLPAVHEQMMQIATKGVLPKNMGPEFPNRVLSRELIAYLRTADPRLTFESEHKIIREIKAITGATPFHTQKNRGLVLPPLSEVRSLCGVQQGESGIDAVWITHPRNEPPVGRTVLATVAPPA